MRKSLISRLAGLKTHCDELRKLGVIGDSEVKAMRNKFARRIMKENIAQEPKPEVNPAEKAFIIFCDRECYDGKTVDDAIKLLLSYPSDELVNLYHQKLRVCGRAQTFEILRMLRQLSGAKSGAGGVQETSINIYELTPELISHLSEDDARKALVEIEKIIIPLENRGKRSTFSTLTRWRSLFRAFRDAHPALLDEIFPSRRRLKIRSKPSERQQRIRDVMYRGTVLRPLHVASLTDDEAEKLLIEIKEGIIPYEGVTKRSTFMRARNMLFKEFRKHFPEILEEVFPKKRKSRSLQIKDEARIPVETAKDEARVPGETAKDEARIPVETVQSFNAFNIARERFGSAHNANLFMDFCRRKHIESGNESELARAINAYEIYLQQSAPIERGIKEEIGDLEIKGITVPGTYLTAIAKEHDLTAQDAELIALLLIEGLRTNSAKGAMGGKYFRLDAVKDNFRRCIENRAVCRKDFNRCITLLKSANVIIIEGHGKGKKGVISLNIHTSKYASQSIRQFVEKLILQNGVKNGR